MSDMIGCIYKLDLKDGDVVVFKYPGKLTKEGYENIKNSMAIVLGKLGIRTPAIILEDSAEIEIVRKESKKEGPLHDAFIEWAKENGISFKHIDDWVPWHECWENGYDQGRMDQNAINIINKKQE